MTTRPTPARSGPSRGGVRVVQTTVHGVAVIRAEWYEHGLRRVKTWPDTREARAEAKAWAKGFAETRHHPAPAPPVTLRGLWERFVLATFDTLRPRTQALYREHWAKWELFLGG